MFNNLSITAKLTLAFSAMVAIIIALVVVVYTTIVKVSVEEGATVAEGDVIVVMEAMKMEQPLKAHRAGTVTGLQAEVGATVTNGAVICEITD